MDIKVLTNVPTTDEESEYYTIGTHNGIFHCDEVVAVALLSFIHSDKKIIIVRSRNEKILNKCDICVDVGGGEFDHHQLGFDKKRHGENGIPYASAGLIFSKFGSNIISKFLSELKPVQNISTLLESMIEPNDKKITTTISEDISNNSSLIESMIQTIDEEIMQPIDAEDNGIDLGRGLHSVSFIPNFCPSWYDKNPNYEIQFSKALESTISVLEEKIERIIDKVYAKETIKSLIEQPQFFSNFILQIPAQTMPWEEAICEYNDIAFSNNEPCVNFVMFPYPNGGWAVQCVPPSLENKFGQRVSFPKEWASNIPLDGITFVHKGGFFARGEKNSLIELCNTAIQIEESKWKQRFEEYGEHCDSQKGQEALEYILGKGVTDTTKETNKNIR